MKNRDFLSLSNYKGSTFFHNKGQKHCVKVQLPGENKTECNDTVTRR